MESNKYILGFPEFINGVGNIYPIKVKDNDEFSAYSACLAYSLKHFNIVDNNVGQHKLLDILIEIGKEEIIQNLIKVFSLVLQKNVSLISSGDYYGFFIDDTHIIDNNNYDLVREVILKQNLIFEPKVFKHKMVQEWAEKVLKARQKNAVKITMEDVITTVSVVKKISYQEVAEMTIYQLNADFKRISKLMGYEKDITLLAAGADIKTIEHYAEEIDMFEDPYGNLFVKTDKLNDLNNALG